MLSSLSFVIAKTSKFKVKAKKCRDVRNFFETDSGKDLELPGSESGGIRKRIFKRELDNHLRKDNLLGQWERLGGGD